MLTAVVVLGLCASSIIACVTTTSQRMRETEQREQILNYARTQMEALIASTRRPTAAAANTNSSVSLSGIAKSVSINKTVSAVSGFTGLYLVEVTATWTATASKSDRAQVLKLTTFVRSPYG